LWGLAIVAATLPASVRPAGAGAGLRGAATGAERRREGSLDGAGQVPQVDGARHLHHPHGPQVGRCPLHVDQRVGVGIEQADEGHQRHLRGVGDVVEHRLAGEQAADRHAVQAAHQLAVRPRLDRVGPAEAVQRAVGLTDVAGDPAVRSARVGAGVDDGPERRIDPDLEAVARLAQRPADAQPVAGQHAPRVGRPPGQPAPADRHGEQADPVGGEQGPGFEVGADPHDAVLVGLVRRGEDPRRGRWFDGHRSTVGRMAAGARRAATVWPMPAPTSAPVASPLDAVPAPPVPAAPAGAMGTTPLGAARP
jgi:hypothetical protein